MTKQQEKLLELFREIDAICKKHHLRYVLAGGTLIGAVRSRGFLSWDDNLDIMMPRNDWNQFEVYVGQEMNEGRQICDGVIDRDYHNTLCRYMDITEGFIQGYQLDSSDPCGVAVNILVLDPIPDQKAYEKYVEDFLLYSDIVNPFSVYSSRIELPYDKYMEARYLISQIGYDQYLRSMESGMFTFQEVSCKYMAMRWGGHPFLFPREMLFPVKYGKFEGIEAMIPRHVSDYLTMHYGEEWAYVPEVDSRRTPQGYSLDGMTSQEIRQLYVDKVDWDAFRMANIVRKEYRISTAPLRHELRRKQMERRGSIACMTLRQRIRQNNINPDQMAAMGQFDDLLRLFEEYFEIQFHPYCVGSKSFEGLYEYRHPLALNISQDLFCIALLTLVYTEHISRAARLIEVWEAEHKKLGEKVLALKLAIEAFRQVTDFYEQGEAKKAARGLYQLRKAYPRVPSFDRMYCRLLMERCTNKGDYSEIRRFVERKLKRYPQDGYYQKYMADCLMAQGEEEEAIRMYRKARAYTQNGVTRLEIDQVLEN